MKKIIFITVFAIIFSWSLPISYIWSAGVTSTGIVPVCEGDNCDFQDFLQLLDSVFNYIVLIAVPLASVAIAYAGIILVTARDDSGKRNEAKGILWAAILGLVIVLAAWLIVNTVLDTLVPKGEFRNKIQP